MGLGSRLGRHEAAWSCRAGTGTPNNGYTNVKSTARLLASSLARGPWAVHPIGIAIPRYFPHAMDRGAVVVHVCHDHTMV